jgi:hypothetical protein
MSPQFRKVALIAAALGLLLSLFVALRPNDDEDAADTTTTAATTAATATEPAETTIEATTTAPPPEPQVVSARIVVPADTAPTVKKLSVQRDKQFVLVVESGVADEVHIHGYDLHKDVAEGATVTFDFPAKIDGGFIIELEDAKQTLANLAVEP